MLERPPIRFDDGIGIGDLYEGEHLADDAVFNEGIYIAIDVFDAAVGHQHGSDADV